VEFILNLLDAMWQIINMFRSIKSWNRVEKQNVETTQLYDNSLTVIEHFFAALWYKYYLYHIVWYIVCIKRQCCVILNQSLVLCILWCFVSLFVSY